MAALATFACALVIGFFTVDCRHVISFNYHNLFPEGFDWDATGGRFIVGSLGHGTLHTISDSGNVDFFVSADLVHPNVTVEGITVDPPRKRLLAVLHAVPPFRPFDALAAYDLISRRRLFLAQLPNKNLERTVANDVTVGPEGDAFVTNSAGNFVWKVSVAGIADVFSDSSLFIEGRTIREELAPECGLNGIVDVGNGDLLVVQTNTGKLYRINASDSTAWLVQLTKDLVGADGMAVDGAGDVAVLSRHTAWLLRSSDGWLSAVVEKETVMDVSRFPTAVAVRDGRFYALYGRIGDWMLRSADRVEFAIEEIDWNEKKDRDGISILLGGFILCLICYLCYIITHPVPKIKTD